MSWCWPLVRCGVDRRDEKRHTSTGSGSALCGETRLFTEQNAAASDVSSDSLAAASVAALGISNRHDARR